MVTPQQEYPELAKALGMDQETSKVYLKREDLHPYGSHKGRSIPNMIDIQVAKGCSHFVISSSGNAALAAGLHVQKLNKERKENEKITIEILAGKNINSQKLEKLDTLKDMYILVSIQDRPLQTLFMKTLDPAVQSLRQSNDDIALVGYESLAEELLEIPDLAAVFMATSSGTTIQSLAQFFESKDRKIEIHAIQTTSCHPIADALTDTEGADEKSIADAIVDQTAIRKDVLVPLLENSGGTAWIATNQEIKSAQELAKKYADISLSPNSALSIAGLMQAVYTGKKWRGSVVCMVCGD